MPKMKKYTTVDKYIASFPPDVQSRLESIRKLIKQEVPRATEDISYGIPVFKLNEKYLVYFATWKKHISLYPISAAMESSIAGMADYKTSGKGTIQFPLDKPLPLTLIREIVRFARDNSAK